MGKSKKNKDKYSYRHDPLDKQILENSFAQPSSRIKVRRKPVEDEKFVDNKCTNEVLKLARQQQEDLEEEFGLSHHNSDLSHLDSYGQPENEDDFSNSFNSIRESETEETKISKEDEEALEKFMREDSQIDVISENIKETLTEKQSEIYTHFSDRGSVFNNCIIDEKLRCSFKEKLAPILNKYRSGKLPKLFKTIPAFTNWEQILKLTEPDQWSDATMYEATRMFSSNLPDKRAQRFYNLFLLPRLRDEIEESGKLTDHMYRALKKALYKPAAFFKGIIIPLCQAKNSKQREATIIGSVLADCSIPVLHSSAALLTIAEMKYSGVNSIFMRILLEKKYALPYRVINAIVNHFLRCMEDTQHFPVLWHQCLLTFVQTYKVDLSPEQKTNLLKLLTVHSHKDITPIIRRQLEEKPDLNEVVQQMWKI